MSRIAVIGNWHLAFVTAAGLAELGHDVVLVNHDDAKPWTVYPVLALDEPGLTESINESVLKGKMRFVNLKDWDRAEGIVWLAIDTPLNEDGSPNSRSVAADLGRAVSNTTKLIVISSQVPIGFCQRMEEVSSAAGVPVACVPENYRFGKAMEIFRDPDRLVIGANDLATQTEVADLFLQLKIHHSKYVVCDLPTAEMIKHATNAFLGTCISFANEMARVATAHGVNLSILEAGLRADTRIGKGAPIRPGGPFTGGTLRRDLRALQRASNFQTPIVDAVLEVNDRVLAEEKS